MADPSVPLVTENPFVLYYLKQDPASGAAEAIEVMNVPDGCLIRTTSMQPNLPDGSASRTETVTHVPLVALDATATPPQLVSLRTPDGGMLIPRGLRPGTDVWEVEEVEPETPLERPTQVTLEELLRPHLGTEAPHG